MGYFVAQLWRYPVKSLAGEGLERAQLGPDGVAGDRRVLVHNERGVVTSRTRSRLLGLHGTTGPDGEPLVDGLAVTSDTARALVKIAAGDDAQLAPIASTARFDVLPLLVVTDGAIRAFGRDGRRLRPNIVIGGVDGLAERSWEGRRLRIGEAVIYLDSLRSP